MSRRFPNFFFGPPFLQGRKGGYGGAFESKNLLPKIASPVASRRFGPSHESDTGALGIASSEIDATAACMYIGRNASDALGGVCSGPSAWRPASVEAPVAGVDKVAQPENSGFPLRKWLRSWLRHAKVARVVVVDFGPSRNSGGSVAAPAHTLREFR